MPPPIAYAPVELLETIFTSSNGNEWTRSDLFHAALVCRGWCGVALELLWSRYGNLVALLGLLGHATIDAKKVILTFSYDKLTDKC